VALVREYSPAEWRAFGDHPPIAEPFVIRGLALDWPAMSRLTFDSLSEIAGDVPVAVARSSGGRTPMPLGAFIDYCRTTAEADPLYLSWPYLDERPGIREWMNPPAVLRSWTERVHQPRKGWSWLFIGPAGSASPPHVDLWLSAAYNVVIAGCKDWCVYPVDHPVSVSLRRQPSEDVMDHAGPDVWTCRQLPGDLIYVPAGMAHSVVNREAGIAFGENFFNGLNYDEVVRLLESEGRADTDAELRMVRMAAAFHDR
jgi:hypothetical protein